VERVSAQQLAEWAAEARERWNVPGIAVGVLQDGAVVSAADGVCELGRSERVSPETVFRIASITKPFTATLAMTLVQEGLLALDEPPPGTPVEATVRQLLSHQGGLASEWPEPLDSVDEDDHALLELTEREPVRLPVGPEELFSYCNAGFWFVAAAIARILGTSFEEALRTRVLEPLGLRSTGFDTQGAARGHIQVEKGATEHSPAEIRYPRVRRPGGGLLSSVGDLLRFAQHHLGGPGPLTAESIAEMQRPLSTGPGFRYGLGWFLWETRAGPAVGHPGSVLGCESLLRLVPGEGLAVAALSNSSRGYAAIRDVVRELGLGEEDLPEVALEDLTAFAGRYRAQDLELELVPEDGVLRVERTEVDPFTGEMNAYPTVRARPVGEREFEIVDGEWRGDRLDFPRPGFVRMGYLATRTE
jgi:CubicO group peptidase (beta-lactamase class C family)